MTAALPGETWIVGCGKMAGAMVEGWQRAGVDFSEATAIRPSGPDICSVGSGVLPARKPHRQITRAAK